MLHQCGIIVEDPNKHLRNQHSSGPEQNRIACGKGQQDFETLLDPVCISGARIEADNGLAALNQTLGRHGDSPGVRSDLQQ